MQQKLLFSYQEQNDVPEARVLTYPNVSPSAQHNLEESGLCLFDASFEEWTSKASSQALNYATHGLHRYFGKFPPTVARHLIKRFTKKGDTILDPMVGSGTTAVEALLLRRCCVALDINPYSILLTRVKTHSLEAEKCKEILLQILARVERRSKYIKPDSSKWPKTIRTEHFFLPETCHWLYLLLDSINEINNENYRGLFLVAFASIVRRVSRATTQQGRLFLDVDTAESDPRARFKKAALKCIKLVSSLPATHNGQMYCEQASAMEYDFSRHSVELIICHPPYFNVYRYSRILSLELGWLGHEIRSIAKKEVREFFKVGKPENVKKYIEDMHLSLKQIGKALRPDDYLALMIGDTRLRGNRIQTTKLLIESVSEFLRPEIMAVRTPKYTEASWVASQRRTGEKVGVSLSDFVIIFRKKD